MVGWSPLGRMKKGPVMRGRRKEKLSEFNTEHGGALKRGWQLQPAPGPTTASTHRARVNSEHCTDVRCLDKELRQRNSRLQQGK